MSQAANAAGADTASPLAARAFFRPELSIRATLVRQDVSPGASRAAAWDAFRARYGDEVQVFVDAWSGTPATIVARIPLIPGDGHGNRVALADLSRRLGREVTQVDGRAVSDAFLSFVRQNQAAFGLDLAQLGAPRAAEARPGLWQVHVPQVYQGIPVRHGRLAATISGGNLVLSGTETWGNVKLDTRPRVSADDALAAGFAHAGGRTAEDEIVARPTLEVVPFASQSEDGSAAYGHRLVWAFTFRRPPQTEVWEVLTDAHGGEVIAFEDTNHPVRRPMTGNAYPATSTEQCPSPTRCGLMRNVPMPFADTGLPVPNDFTNGAGLFPETPGGVTTTLSGRFVNINDNCGPTSETAASGALFLGGATGEHDCETPSGGSAGNTASARGVFYELNKWAEVARGWLPTLPFLQNTLPANVNIAQTCNAFWSPATQSVNFYRSGGGCRNSGELAAVIYHEVGHGLDDNDANGFLSNSSEGYADIAAIYRQGSSCVGYGFFETVNQGCGTTADGTGFNANERQTGGTHCNLNCSGVRDADWTQHADQTPDTPLNFVCGSCLSGSGPCGRQVHCAAAPVRQAAWDLVARDLTAAPFGLSFNEALIVGNKLFYEGSGNVGNWYECNCAVSISGGCGAFSGYMQWLAADDDNGNLNDGTPHMTAIFNAFHRHGIACSVPPVLQNSGCAGRPTQAPAVTLTPGPNRMTLDWNAVPNATEYWVFRSEGNNACETGKARIAQVAGTSFTDLEVADRRSYCYSVMAVGPNDQCLGPASPCACKTPETFTLSCNPGSFSLTPGAQRSASCQVTTNPEPPTAVVSLSCQNLPSQVSCAFSPASVTPPDEAPAVSQLTLAAGANPAGGLGGTFASKVVANYGDGVVREFPISISVSGGLPTFTLTCDQTELFLLQDSSTTTFCRVRSHNGFSSPVSLACNPANASGVTCSLSAAPVTPPANGSVAVSLRVTAARLAPPGVRSFSVKGTSGATTRTVGITVEVEKLEPPF